MKSAFRTILILALSVLLAVGLVVAVSASPEAVDGGYCGADTTAVYDEISGAYRNIAWTLYDNGELVFEGSGPMTDYTWDETYTYETTAPWAPYLETISSVRISEGITKIGMWALARSEYATGDLVIPDSVTEIGEDAFFCYGNETDACGTLTLGDGLVTIGDSAFDCSGLSGPLVIPDSVTEIGDYAFADCYYLTGSLVIPDGVTYLGFAAFRREKSMTGKLTLGSGLTEIQGEAFLDCVFTGALEIPDGISEIDGYAFDYCRFDSVVIGRGVEKIRAQGIELKSAVPVYFLGDAPDVYPADSDYRSFATGTTLYYNPARTGWTDSTAYDEVNGTWNGYKLAEKFAAGTISGFFTSVNPNVKATVTLTCNGDIVKQLTFPTPEAPFAETQPFTIDDLEPAVYTVLIEKPAHLPAVMTDVSVSANEELPIGILPLYAGDLNGDLFIDALDITILSGNLLMTPFLGSLND